MKIAVPLAEGILSAHFGHCTQVAVFDADSETRTVRGRQDVPAPVHEPGVFPVWLAGLGVDVILAGGMGSRARDLFAEHGVGVVTGVTGEHPCDLVAAFLADELVSRPHFCEK